LFRHSGENRPECEADHLSPSSARARLSYAVSRPNYRPVVLNGMMITK
jgi:hypothetical protein